MASLINMNMSRKILGTKLSIQNSQLLLSSGIPSLDHVAGGGIAVGSLFIIEEDEYANYSRVMLKYFMAEGIVSQQPLLVASLDSEPARLVSELPAPTNIETGSSNTELRSNNLDADLKIAWRYNNLGPVESTLGSSIQFGHYYDLTKTMEKDMLDKTSKLYWGFSPLECKCIDQNKNIAYEDLLLYIQKHINEGGFSKSNPEGNKKVLRICIESLGSPPWEIYQKHLPGHDDPSEGKHLINFMFRLRAILRSASAVAFITIPTKLFENPDVVLKIRHAVDTAIRLDSFVGTNRESNPVLRDYHGFFYLSKLSAINTLVPFVPTTLDLAFKLRRKKFLIEKLHLPPELQDSSGREQDDNATLGCGGNMKRNLDF